MGPGTETPSPEGTWDQAARKEVIAYRDPAVDRQMPVKILPCPKLRLRAVKMSMGKGTIKAQPLLRSNFFHFDVVSAKTGWRIPLWEILDPPLELRMKHYFFDT